MTGPERHELAELNARLFGLDGSGEGGAVGAIMGRIDSIEKQVNRWAGALAVLSVIVGTLGLGGLVAILQAITAHP